jgi:exonuclease VII large subunit
MAEKTDEHRGEKPRAPEQIAQLFAAAAGGHEEITWLIACVADLNAATPAKSMLAILSAVKVREALPQRRNSPRDAR